MFMTKTKFIVHRGDKPEYFWSVELGTSALVVATVSAKATRNICSSRVRPGRLECMRWLDNTYTLKHSSNKQKSL